MICKPWDCAQPDEWLPQSLRLCWGGGGESSSGDGGGGWGGDSGGGWSGDGGFGGATTGGGDWGSSGSYDASGFNSGFEGPSTFGAGGSEFGFGEGGGGGDWGSFGTTSYAGMNAPNPTFADVAGPNPGVTTGGGDWGSAGTTSFAGTGGAPGGGFWGDSGGGTAYGGGGGSGGGFWGDTGGGGGGYTGGGGQQGGGGSFGSFGSGTLGASNAVAAAPTGPSGSTFADSYGGGSLAGPSSAASSGHSMGSLAAAAAASDAGPSESDAAPSEGGDTSTAPSESQFGEPTSSEAAPAEAEAGPSLSDAAPAGMIHGGSLLGQDNAPSETTSAPAETEAAPSAFGPQSVIAGGRETNFDYGPSQAYQDASQQLSDLTQSALATQPDSFDSRFGFDASAPAPDISASIPGGRETSFDYGPGEQTAGPDFNQSFEAFNAQPGWNPGDQLAGRAGLAEPTDWGANPYQPSTDVSVGRDFNQAFDAFGDTPTGMDLAGDMRTEDGSVNPNSTFQLGWEPANAYAGRGPDDASGRAAQDYVTSLVSGAPLGAAAPGLLSALSAATGIPAAAWLGGSVPTAGILGLMGLDPSARPAAPQQQVTEVELVSPQDVPAPPPPQEQQQPQEAQPAQPEAQPQAQPPEAQPQAPQEAQQAQPQEAQQTQPTQTEQAQPQEAQPAPPSLIEQAQTLPSEVQPVAPPSLIEQAQPLPGSPLAFPGTPTTALPPQPTTARPVAPADEHEDEADPQVNTPVEPGTPLGAPTSKTQNTPVTTARVRQEQQGATRSRPVSEALHSILTRAAEQANVVVRIGSGGQPSTGRDRTGSHRHDHGNAADIRLEQNGRLLNYNNPTDRPIMEAFVREAARLGATGMGAGMRYMGPNTIHVGFGNPNFWRADNPGSLGLRQAWNEGRQGPANRPPADIPNVRTAQAPAITFYAPGAKGRMEGKYETSQPNPLTGKNTPSTLDDVRLGNSPFVTLAGNPSRYGEKVDLGTINYTSPIDGKTYTLNNVQGIVHDTGSAFKGRSDKLDVAVGDFRGWTSSKASTFVANNSRQQPAASQVAAVPQGRQTAALLPGRPGIGSDRSNIPWAPPADISVPTALPPQAPQETRPPADIPAPAPPVAAPPTPAQIRASHITAAKGIIAEHSKGLNKDSDEAKATAAYVKAGAAMAKAGIPANIARAELLAASEKGAAQAGYSRTMFMIGGKVGAAIDAMVDAAMQSYQSALPGKRSDVGGQQYADLSQSIGPIAPGSAGNAGSMTGRPGEIGAQQPMFSIPGLDRLSPIIAPPAPPEPPANSRELASLFDTRFLAKGGHVAKDEKVVVGEEGPEYFIPDEPGTVVPHMPQPGKTGKSENIDRWPKIPAPNFPGRYGGVEREMLRQTREAQNPVPGLIDMIDSGRLPLNAANWHAMMNDPSLIALGRSRMGTVDAPAPEPAAEPPDPTSPLAQALGYGSIKRRPMQIGRQSYQP